MALWDEIKSLDSKFSWSFFGFILAIVGIAAGAYFSLRTPITEITYDIINESNVLDVHQQVESLNIFFRNENIRDKGLNIRALSVLIENTGDTNIKQVDFDQNENWGIYVENGEIVNASFTGYSSGYLKNNLSSTRINGNSINFPKIMFDKNEKAALDILILHDNKTKPRIQMIGKISGIDKFKIKNSFTEKKNEIWYSKIFEGPFFLQLIRLVVFFFIGIGLLFLLVFISEKSDDYKNKKLLKTRENKFKNLGFLANDIGIDVLTDVYLNSDLAGLKKLHKQLSDSQVLTELVQRYSDVQHSVFGKEIKNEKHVFVPDLYLDFDFKMPTIIQSLKDTGAITEQDNQWFMNSKFEENLNNAIRGL